MTRPFSQPRPPSICACGGAAIDVVRIASDEGLLLVPVCAECIDDPVAEQRELFDTTQRRPLSATPPRGHDPQQPLPFEESDEQGAA